MQKKTYTNCKHLFADQSTKSDTSPDPSTRENNTRGKINSTTFLISCDPPPTCPMLTELDEKSVADWRRAHQQYLRLLKWYNQDYNTAYKPHLRKWVPAKIWRMISAELLEPEDSTDPTTGEMPNDEAVVCFLLQTGRYKSTRDSKVGAYWHGCTYGEFISIKWPEEKGMTHTKRLEVFLNQWFDLAVTIKKHHMPREEDLCRIMLDAVQPRRLRMRIWEGMMFGRSPRPRCDECEQWRKDSQHVSRNLRRLIREHTVYLDQTSRVPREAGAVCQNLQDLGERHKSEEWAVKAGTWRTTRPTCVVEGCNNLCNNKRRGSSYHKTCKEHAHVSTQ